VGELERDHYYPTSVLLPTFREEKRKSPLVGKRIFVKNNVQGAKGEKVCIIIGYAKAEKEKMNWDIDEECMIRHSVERGEKWPSKMEYSFEIVIPPNSEEVTLVAEETRVKLVGGITGRLMKILEEMKQLVIGAKGNFANDLHP